MGEIKVMENPIPTGYMNLEDCIKSWGDKGIRIYDGMIRQRMRYGGISDKDIHTPPDGNSLRSRESPTPFSANVKLI